MKKKSLFQAYDISIYKKELVNYTNKEKLDSKIFAS